MKEFEPQEITEKLQAAPRVIRDYIHSSTTSESIRAIAKKHGLLLDKAGDLANETIWVMIGLVQSNEFIPRIKEEFGLSDSVASALERDISEQIVKPAIIAMQSADEVPDISRDEINRVLEAQTEEFGYDVDTSGLASTGIEIMPRQEAEQIMPQINRETLLAGVENPKSTVKTFPPDIIAQEVHRGIAGEKLSGGFTIPKESRDYSIGKSQTPPPADDPILRHRDRTDPYREPI